MPAPRTLPGVSQRLAKSGVVCVLALCAIQHNALAQDEPQDLQGIIPAYVPNGLAEGDFAQLGGNWAEWADQTGQLVTDFYTADDPEVRGRRQTLEDIQARLRTMDRALSDAAYLPIYGPLADLHGRLSRRMAVSAALLETIGQDVTRPDPARVRSTMNTLDERTASLLSYLQSINGGPAWIDYLSLAEVADIAGRADTAPEAAALLDEVRQKLSDRESLNEVQQSFLDRQPLARYAGAINRAASLVNVEDPQDRQQQLRDLSADLLDAVEEYEENPTTGNAARLRDAFDDIRRLSPDGGAALTAAMRKHYLNYNLRVVVDESLMRDVVRQSQSDSGFINEMVSRAHISGCQWTNATVNLDLKPSNHSVRFDLILDGNVRSSVRGSTHMATVNVAGQFSFHGRKPVDFDGDRFTTSPARVSVNGGNRPYAARTRVSWIPLVGRIAENAALREAGSPENSQYARNKVYREARSQFDSDTDRLLRDAEGRLQSELVGPLNSKGYYPAVKQLRSTETEARLRTRLMEPGEVGGGDVLALPIAPARGVLVQLHESLLNQIADRLDLDGKRFTPDALQEYLKSEVEQITGTPADFSAIALPDEQSSDLPRVEEILFHDSDAIRFRMSGGEVILHLAVGLKLEGREEIEPQQITVPLQFSLAGGKIHMERGTVGVSPLGPVPPAQRAQQITRANVMRQKIQETFEPQDLDSTFAMTVEDKQVRLRVTDLRARSGWLSLIATNGVSESTPPAGPPVLQQVGLDVSR